MSDTKKFRCGYVAIVGRPNTGKSTLLNRLVRQKVSIITHKPQTTRHQVLGICTGKDAQIIYVDTPGLYTDIKRPLNQCMNRAALSALEDVDAVIFMVGFGLWGKDEDILAEKINALNCPVILAINKIDLVKDKLELLPWLEELQSKVKATETLPISASKGTNTTQLETIVHRMLPEGIALFPEDQLTDRSERFLVSELVREKLMMYLHKEIPYQLAVEVESFKEEDQKIYILATIWAERSGQKGIVIGKKGQVLKSVGTEARKDIERLLGKRVDLRLMVKIRKNWAHNAQALRQMGYGDFTKE